MICESRLAKNFSYQPTKIMLKELKREREREHKKLRPRKEYA